MATASFSEVKRGEALGEKHCDLCRAGGSRESRSSTLILRHILKRERGSSQTKERKVFEEEIDLAKKKGGRSASDKKVDNIGMINREGENIKGGKENVLSKRRGETAGRGKS